MEGLAVAWPAAKERVYDARVSTDRGFAVPEAPKIGSLGKALSRTLITRRTPWAEYRGLLGIFLTLAPAFT